MVVNVIDQLEAVMPEIFGDQVAVEEPVGRGVHDVIPKGQRDNSLASLAGGMRRKGFSVEAIAAAIGIVNEQRCRPPLPAADIERIARSVGRYQPARAEAHGSRP